jgi:hypothetical protein
MPDNLGYTPGSGAKVATREVTYSGETANAQAVGLVTFTGPDDGKVAEDISDGNPLPVKDGESIGLLRRILQMLMSPLGYDKSLQRQRATVVVESGTVTTVGGVATVNDLTRLNNLEAYNARMLVLDSNRTAWAQCVRSRIT